MAVLALILNEHKQKMAGGAPVEGVTEAWQHLCIRVRKSRSPGSAETQEIAADMRTTPRGLPSIFM